MTGREKEVFQTLKKLGGKAHPSAISGGIGISPDYAEQICRDMVWRRLIKKTGLLYEIIEKQV